MQRFEPVNLKHLVARIKMCEKFIVDHPERKESLLKNIEQQKEYIVQCVLQNADNPHLDKIQMK